MNSMRLLILLTFILYETQCAPSIKSLKILKSILEGKYPPPIVRVPTFETEIFPINNCEYDAKGDIIVELNPQYFENKEKPVFIEIENVGTNPHVIPVEVHEENPEVSSQTNDGANNEQNPDVISGTNVKENPKENAEEADKNENADTQMFIGGITSEKKPAVTDGEIQHGEISIKEKIKAKIEMIRSKLKSRQYPVGPVPEISTQDSSFLFEEDDFMSTTQQPSTPAEPITSAEPITPAEPIATTSNPNVSGDTALTETTVGPVTTARPATTAVPVSQPLCANVNDGGECDDVVITIPNHRHRPHKFYLSPTTYQLFFVNCPSPWAPERCYRPNHHYVPNPIYPNKLAATPINLAAMAYYGPNFGTYKGAFASANVVNYNNDNDYDAAGMSQPASPIGGPAQNERSWDRYSVDGVSPVVSPDYPALYPAPRTEIPVVPAASPDPGVPYPTSTARPTAVNPDELLAPSLPADRPRDLTQPRVPKTKPDNQWTQYPGPVPDLTDAQDYPQQKPRGDMMYEPQDQGDEYTYPMNERRHARSDDDGNLFAPNDNVRLSGQPRITPVEIPPNELQARDETTAAKTEKPVAAKSPSDTGDSAVE